MQQQPGSNNRSSAESTPGLQTQPHHTPAAAIDTDTSFEFKGGDPASASRRPNPPLWLLPSGPDQIHGVSSRETNGITMNRPADLIEPLLERLLGRMASVEVGKTPNAAALKD